MTDTTLTRHDLDTLRNEIKTDMQAEISSLRIEWRQEMVTHIRWLAGLFIVQFVATVGATAGLVAWMINVATRIGKLAQ